MHKPMHQRLSGWLAAISVALCAVALPVSAQTAGRDYVPIEPVQASDNPAKIEVIEFFSYGCPHCADFNPTVTKWAAKLPADVSFRKVPVSFNAFFATLAPIYYALEAVGSSERLDADVFKAISDGVKLQDEKTRLEWVTRMGVDGKKFTDAFNSFAVNAKVKRAELMTRSYHVQGVPALAIDGKYMVLNEGIRGNDELVARADKVIDKVRAERNKKK